MPQKEIVSVSGVWKYTLCEKPDKSFGVKQYRDTAGEVFTVVGADIPEYPDLRIELFGTWEPNRKTGKDQFKYSYFNIPKQFNRDGVVAYLKTLTKVGPKRANLIYDHFGIDTIETLNQNPERLLEVPGIGEDTARLIMDSYKSNTEQREISLMFMRANTPLSSVQVSSICSKLQPHAVKKLKENPYCLCGLIPSISFEKCDALAESLEYSMSSINRLKAYIFRVLQRATNAGHVCLPKDILLRQMVYSLNREESECKAAINAVCQEGLIKCLAGNIFMVKQYSQENSIAYSCERLLSQRLLPISEIDALIEEYEKQQGLQLAEQQKAAVRQVFRSPLSIITGGPGTGKTTVVKAILNVHQMIYGETSAPMLLAPTGKAARRMSSATGYPAATIHSAVGYKGNPDDDTEDLAYNDIDANIVIVDEVSMMDQNICAILMRQIISETRVVFVGDPNQLPSVGYGNVLLDMIQSGVIPTTTLNVIYRQKGSSPIILNAHRIREGNPDLVYENRFRMIEASGSNAFTAAVDMYLRCVRAYGMDNVLLLTPLRKKSALSVNEFNKCIQSIINPAGKNTPEISIGRTVFRKGDRIMQLKNTEIAQNGEVGYIVDIIDRFEPNNPKQTRRIAQIEFNHDGIIHDFDVEELEYIDLAYCSTVHKAQGEEYQSVIMVVSSEHSAVLRRNIIYTGITRSRENVCIIGETKTLTAVITSNRQDVRYSCLIPRLRAIQRHMQQKTA